MDVSKTLIATSVSVALLGGVWGSAVAKKSDEEDSVYRWGRWAVLAPAAGQEEVIAYAPAGGGDLGRCDSAANCPDPNLPQKPEQPEQPEQPEEDVSKLVGYARIDYRERGSAQAYPRNVGTFEAYVGDDESAPEAGYIVSGPSAPDGENVSLDSGYLPVTGDASGFRSTSRGNDSFSGRFTYGADGELAIVEGPWRQIADDGSHAHSGEYVLGFTATKAEIATLMDTLDIGLGGDIFAQYSGPTATGGSIDLSFNLSDSEGRWTGEVRGTVLDFQAGGTLSNAEFVADQFSDNISRGAMQGALVNAGNNAIGSFAVESDIGEGGLLREADIFNAALTSGAPALEAAVQ